MTFVYLTTDAPERFPAPGEAAEPVLLNANKKQFCLIASPSRQAIASMIEDYARRRLDAHWQFLMEPHSARCINLFQIAQRRCVYAPSSVLQRCCDVDSQAALRTALESMSLAEQRKRVRPLKPASIPEMLAFFSDTKLHDMTGYSYLQSVLSRSDDAFAFFGRLIDEFLLGLAGTDYELGTPKSNFHQPRVLEFLGLATAANWLLFPFVHRSSGIWEHQVLTHHANVSGYFDPAYRPSETQALMDDLRRAEANSPSHVKLVAQLRNLVVCSTYRRIEQSSTALFRRCLELIGQVERPMIPQQVGMARITFNALIRLHQVQCPNAPNQPVLIRARKAPTVAEFSDFPEFRAQGERWTVWADTMQQFVASGTRSDPQTLKTACLDLVEFLLSMRSPPSRPELTERRHINTMTESGECFRNFLRDKHSSAAVRNGRLNLVSQFFDFVRASLLAEYRGPAHQAPWFSPPVDIKLDRFQERYRAGTQRKAIAAEVLELMREVLVENDYAWSKAQTAWVNLPDRKTGRLEYVWCPSSAILLYLMLSVPLRSLQARMLDSGEGDASLYDFDSARMVRNRNQLPVEGRIDPARREGLLQVMPSGLPGVVDFVGLWVNTDKVSEDGYAIPWVSDELLTHLRYQREWVQRFSPYPTMHGAKQAQGHRNTPLTWEERDPKFYCLFRDLSAEKGVDPSLPVSRQKLLKLWGALCLEVQTRLNSRLGPDRTKVMLVKEGSTANQPMALYDLHTLRVSGITDLLDRGVPLNIVSQYVAGHATYMMTLWYDSPAPGALREALKQAHESAGQRASSLPSFSLEDVDSLRAHLVSLDDARHPGRFTGFDALDENGGLMLVRQAGICPGTRCEEGGLDESGRAVPVPFGDRGPSCPQCRFWLTGPAFLLGQVIEGNQLILKIRRKVAALARLRERIVEARDEGANSRGDVLAAQADVEERQLNDMLTEWWHRMRAYEASLRKLEDYRAYRQTSGADANPVMLVANSHSEALSYGFRQATDLELRHFLSTCEELVPDFTSESLGARQDIELAVSKFLAMNGDAELATLFFQLDDTQRVAVANLTVELMLRTAATPGQASQVLEGRAPLSSLPEVQRGIEQLLGHSRRRTVRRKADPIGVERAT